MPLKRAPYAAADTKVPFAPAPRRSPMVDRETLIATREWLTWFELSYRRQGEAHAPSNAELDEGLSGTQGDLSDTQEDLSGTQDALAQTQEELEATRDELDATQAVLTTTQGELTALTARVTTLEATVTALATTVTDQGTRLDALEAHLAAIVAAVPAAVTVAGLPTLTEAPASADALRDNLTSGWEGVLETNDTALATMANALRLALLETA